MIATLEIAEKLYTVEEWLALEKDSDVRHEYYFGKLIPMAGEAKRANKMANNILVKLRDPLLEKGFEIYDHDVKTEVLSGGIYRYPDLIVAPVVDDEDDYIVKLPVLMVEVSSQNSGHRDRVKKRREYRDVASIWYYLVIDQDEMLVELHVKREDGRWETQYFTEPEDELSLERFGLKLKLSDIYARVKLDLKSQ